MLPTPSRTTRSSVEALDADDVVFETDFANDDGYRTTDVGLWNGGFDGPVAPPSGWDGLRVGGDSVLFVVRGEGLAGTNAANLRWDPDASQPTINLGKASHLGSQQWRQPRLRQCRWRAVEVDYFAWRSDSSTAPSYFESLAHDRISIPTRHLTHLWVNDVVVSTARIGHGYRVRRAPQPTGNRLTRIGEAASGYGLNRAWRLQNQVSTD